MKRLLALLLMLTLLVGITACRENSEPVLQPINFYYISDPFTYGSAEGLIRAQIADAAHYNGSLLETLNGYLAGPNEAGYGHTFPTGSQVYQIDLVNETAYLQMNNAFARLKGIDLTVACACLTMTVMELTGSKSVNISTLSIPLDGNASITMSKDTILLITTQQSENEVNS